MDEASLWTAAIPDVNLRCMIRNAKQVASRSYQRGCTWALVSHVFGVGSTHATLLCKRAGIDPDAKVSAR